MPNDPKVRSRVRAALKNVAIYNALADVSKDASEARDFRRLSEIQLSLAKRWAGTEANSNGLSTFRVGRFSISLVLLRLAAKLFHSARIAGFLRRGFRRTLSIDGEEYFRAGFRDDAVESMELLDQLSLEEKPEGTHIEHGSLVTRSGALRAAVLGVNDGLVSNTSLVLGVAAGTDDPGIVLLAGAVGLVGGALSMAAGEYISVVSQREFNANLVRWERVELLLWHEEEEEELVEILMSKGLDSPEAKSDAARIMSDPEIALDMHVREELGIDPDELGGSPLLASASSLAAFASGALVPLLPYLIGLTGTTSLFASATAAAVALAIVGGGLGWLSGSGTIYGALRMLAVGLVAAAITYGLGSLVGQQIG